MASKNTVYDISDDEDNGSATKRPFSEKEAHIVPSATLQVLDGILFDWTSDATVSVTEPSWNALSISALSSTNAKVPASPQTAFETLNELPPRDQR